MGLFVRRRPKPGRSHRSPSICLSLPAQLRVGCRHLNPTNGKVAVIFAERQDAATATRREKIAHNCVLQLAFDRLAKGPRPELRVEPSPALSRTPKRFTTAVIAIWSACEQALTAPRSTPSSSA